MQLTKTVQEMILKMVRESPLQESEYRRIEGWDAMYLARSEAPPKIGYNILLAVRLDYVPYKICLRRDSSA